MEKDSQIEITTGVSKGFLERGRSTAVLHECRRMKFLSNIWKPYQSFGSLGYVDYLAI